MSAIEIVVIAAVCLVAWGVIGLIAIDAVGDKLKGRSIYAHMAVFAFGAIVMVLYVFYAPFAAFLDIYRENQKDKKP